MNDIITALLVIGAAGLIYIAERQQEVNAVALILESKGVRANSNEIKDKISSSWFYSISTILLAIAISFFIVFLTGILGNSYLGKTSALALLISLSSAGCVLRVMALLRIIKDAATDKLGR